MTPDTLHPVYLMLRAERESLTLARMGADLAVHLTPDDPDARRDQAVAVSMLAGWDALHAEEWNALKPWYERRLTPPIDAHDLHLSMKARFEEKQRP